MEFEGEEEAKEKGEAGERGEEKDGNERRSNRRKTTVVPFTPGTGEAKTRGTKEKTNKAGVTKRPAEPRVPTMRELNYVHQIYT